jgi:hypothetical protein
MNKINKNAKGITLQVKIIASDREKENMLDDLNNT